MSLIDLSSPDVQRAFNELPPHQKLATAWRLTWLHKALPHQVLPHGDWWSTWLMLAGRGAGKTKTASEQIGWWAWEYPETRWLVAAPTSADVRSTCFEGDSGLLNCIPAPLVADYNKALHELRLVNGSLIKGIPASEPERFRGPQFHGGWCCAPDTLIALADGQQRAIKYIVPGDVVMTRHGPRKVIASGPSGNPNDLVRIACGATRLTVTVDHPILVGDQWIPAGDIKVGDLLWATNTSVVGTRTGSYTSSISGQSRLAGSFITRTKTRATTTLRTLKRCLDRSIRGFMQREGKPQNLKKPLRLKHLLHSAPKSIASAFSAATGLSRSQPESRGSFVRAYALSGGAAIDLSRSSGTALFAGLNTPQRNDFNVIAQSDATQSQPCALIELRQTAVQSVERLPNSPTYNLTVEGEHEFIANGIVVHNCDELAAWEYLQDAWDMMQFGMRLKLPDMPTRLICTTTPKPKDLIMELVARDGEDVVVTTASTHSNFANLSDNFKRQIMAYEGTKLGRQEIYAEIIDPEEGGIISRDWFKLWPDGKPFPKFEYVLQSYDCATSEKTSNDPTACTVWGVFKPLDGPMSVMLIDAWQDRLQYPDLRPKVIDEYGVVFGEGKDKKRVDLILIEDKSAGISLIQDLQRAHLPVMAYNPGRADKIQRLNIVSNIIARGRVWIPESSKRKGYVRDWAEGFVSQICAFPETSNDDYVDTCTQALRYLRDGGWLEIDPPPQDDWDEDDYVDTGRVRTNPYAA